MWQVNTNRGESILDKDSLIVYFLKEKAVTKTVGAFGKSKRVGEGVSPVQVQKF